MKKFEFHLDTVLDYKQQELDARMNEYGAAVEQANRQALVLEDTRRRFAQYNEEYREKKAEGLSAADALKYQSCIEALAAQIKQAEERLIKLRDLEEKKRLEVVAARQETASLEKLREIREKEYNDGVAKAEEKAIDDLIAARSVTAG